MQKKIRAVDSKFRTEISPVLVNNNDSFPEKNIANDYQKSPNKTMRNLKWSKTIKNISNK